MGLGSQKPEMVKGQPVLQGKCVLCGFVPCVCSDGGTAGQQAATPPGWAGEEVRGRDGGTWSVPPTPRHWGKDAGSGRSPLWPHQGLNNGEASWEKSRGSCNQRSQCSALPATKTRGGGGARVWGERGCSLGLEAGVSFPFVFFLFPSSSLSCSLSHWYYLNPLPQTILLF